MAELGQHGRHARLVLLNVCLGQFMTALNNRAILIALPTLTELFQSSLTTIQWIVLIYELVFIGIVLTVGRMGDLLGRKKIYITGFIVFVFASVLCGFSQTPIQLIAFRGMQALGGAMITGNGRALLSVVFPPSMRGRAMGVASMAFHVGFLTGPTLGGFLLDTVDWRWIFFLNVPPGLLGAYMGWKVLKTQERPDSHVAIDVSGALLLLLSNACFLYAMGRVPDSGVRDHLFLMFAGLALSGAVFFIWHEGRAVSPILSLSLFRHPVFAAGNFGFFVVAIAQSGVSFLLPFYLQGLLNFSPSGMGWIIISNSVVIIIVAPIAGWLSDRLGSRMLCTMGAGLMTLGYFFIGTLGLDSSVARIIAPLLLSGFGWAIFNSPNLSAILGAVTHDQLGAATGVNLTLNRTGAAIGVALAASLFMTSLVDSGISSELLHSPENWGSQPKAFVDAFTHTVRAMIVFGVVAVISSVLRVKKSSQ